MPGIRENPVAGKPPIGKPPAGKPVFHGRRHGRRLSPLARETLAWGLAEYGIDPAATTPLTSEALFGAGFAGDVFLEIGFGGGEHLAARALASPDAGFIGAEPFMDGVAKLCRRLRDDGIGNIRIFPDDMRLLAPRLADGSIKGVFILFPDPWPKNRHAARRILAGDMPRHLARLIPPGGEVLLASDDATAKSWLLRGMLAHKAEFTWLAESPSDWREPPAGRPLATRYMQKAVREGRKPAWFLWRRRQGGEATREPQ